MLFQRSLLREFATLAAAVFLTLVAISVTARLVRLLGQAAGGQMPSDSVVAFLGFFTLGTLPVLLSLTLFISVLLALTRSYRDSEMVIWFSSGLSLLAWLRPVLSFALPIVALIGVLSFVIAPWAAQKGEEYRARIDTRDDVSRVSPGVFGETAGGGRVFFVESVSDDASAVQNVFIHSIQHQRSGVVTSVRGHIEQAPNGDRFLVLENGRRYEGEAGKADYSVTEFERYASRIQAKEAGPPAVSRESVSTLALIDSTIPAYRAELLWRIGLPLSALVLALIAIPMSFVNPRAGRSMNLMLALFTYMTYSNLLSLSQVRVAQGKLDFSTAWWLVHGVMLALLALLFVWRLRIIRMRL